MIVQLNGSGYWHSSFRYLFYISNRQDNVNQLIREEEL